MRAVVAAGAAAAAAAAALRACNETTLALGHSLHLSVSGGSLSVAGMNSSVLVEVRIAAAIAESGACVLPGEKVAALFKAMNGDIEISARDGESCTVRCGRSNFRLRALPSAGHPPSFAVEGNAATAALRAGDAKRLFGDVATAACSESMRAHMNGVHLFSDGGHLGAVAADGIRLQFRSAEAPYCGPCVLVPLSACELAVKLFAKSSAPLLRTNGRLIEIAGENARIVSKLVDARFPENWRAIVPEPAANAATFSVAEVTRALQRIATIAGKVDTVKLSWDETVGGEATVTLDGVSSADDFVTASDVSGRAALRFDAAMMLTMVGAIDFATVRISAKPESTIRLDAPGRRDLALLAPRLSC